jgi:trigger factor
MKVTQEKLPDSQISLQIEIPADISRNTYEKILNNLARSANIPGFRRGKVPRSILLQRFDKEQLKAAAVEEIIQTGIKDAIAQESIKMLGNPRLDSKFEELVEQFSPGEVITFAATIEVLPTVELGDYKSLSIKAEEVPDNPQKIEDWLQQQRERQATLVPVEDRPAALGDVAIADYQGYYLDEAGGVGEPIPDVAGTNLQVELEAGRFIEGMLEGIVGMSLEETKEIPLTFPDDYPLEAIAGKSVIFSVTLKELKAKELPELDDEFAEEVSEFETLAELRESLAKRFQEEAARETKANIQAAIAENLLEIAKVDLPEILIAEEIKHLLNQTLGQMQQMGIDVQDGLTEDYLAAMQNSVRPEAIKNLQRDMILQEIATAEAFTVAEEEVETRLQEILQQISEKNIDREKLQGMIENQLLQQKTYDWLQEQVTVELVPQGTLSQAGGSTAEVSETAEEE